MDATCGVLLHVKDLAEQFVRSTSSDLVATRSPPSSSTTPSPTAINLPDPPSLLPTLLSADLERHTAIEVDYLFRQRALELRKRVELIIARGCAQLAEIPVPINRDRHIHFSDQAFISTASRFYSETLAQSAEKIRVSLSNCPSTSWTSGTKTSVTSKPPSFNYEYVPLLEHFFNENPFPTHADKAFLAKKSGMTYRQIHVWFQNRRNRTKREGKFLRRKPMSEGTTLPLTPLLQSMEKFIIPQKHRKNVLTLNISGPTTSHEDDLEASSTTDILINALESPAPPHAFPSSYPPLCLYDPFPSRSGETNFGIPKWSRTPIETPVRHSPVDFDWLIGQFSRINVADDSIRGKVDSLAATAAITVRPLSAPHPALIRRMATYVTRTNVSLPSVPATVARLHVFSTPSPPSGPVTLVPTSGTSIKQKTRRRKVAPLPRRVPHDNPIPRQDVTPVISEASVTPSPPSSPSQLSSFGSDSSSQSRLFSSATSISSCSSTITTPPSSLPSPSAQLPSPAASLLNLSPSIVDLLDDSLQGSPSSAEGLQIDFNSSFS